MLVLLAAAVENAGPACAAPAIHRETAQYKHYSRPPGELKRHDDRGSSDPDGTIAFYRWHIELAGTTLERTGVTAEYTFALAGNYSVRLEVADDRGASATVAVQINATRWRRRWIGRLRRP